MPITRKDIEVIFHARKSILYNNGEPWLKKEGVSFDVTMGAMMGWKSVNLLASICCI